MLKSFYVFYVLKQYLQKNYIPTILIGYFVLSVFLSAFTTIDITIPCLWRTLFGIRCPGCGFTTACIHLLKLEFIEAYQANKFIVFCPIFLFYGIIKFVKYYQSNN